MKSFTEELGTRDRKFEIGGEVFEWRDLNWYDIEKLAGEEEAFLAKDEPTTKETMDFTIERIVFFLSPENDAHKRFKALVKRQENPVPHFQVQELHVWLWENVSGRPTQPLPGSSNGPGSTETSSQDG